jgi:hypothetical protein
MEKIEITFVVFLTTAFFVGMYGLTTVDATGGGEVIELVIPIIDETTLAVQNNDTQKALTLLDEIKTELKDTFFAEEEDEGDKKDKKKKNKD